MRKREEINSNNTSGYTGVNWSEEKQKWHAKLGVGARRYHLGYFKSIEKAHQAYLKARKKHEAKEQ